MLFPEISNFISGFKSVVFFLPQSVDSGGELELEALFSHVDLEISVSFSTGTSFEKGIKVLI